MAPGAAFKLLDLPVSLLCAVAASLDDGADRKALRAACRALRAAVDTTIGGVTLYLRDVWVISAAVAAGGPPRLLQHLQRLHLYEACNDPNADYSAAIASFAVDQLCNLTQLTRLEVSGRRPDGEEEPWFARNFRQRGPHFVRLLAHAPESLTELHFELPYYQDFTDAADLSAVFGGLQRCTGLQSLALPYHLGSREGTAAALALAAQRPLRQLELRFGGGPPDAQLDDGTLKALSCLTDLTKLALRNHAVVSSLGLGMPLGSLTALRDLELEDWFCGEADCTPLGRTLSSLTCLTRFAWSDTQGSFQVPSSLFPSFTWSFLSELIVPNNEVRFAEAAVLCTLPQLTSLSARILYFRDSEHIRFASLERLRLRHGFAGGHGAEPATYVRAFPSLRFCAVTGGGNAFFPVFDSLDRAVIVAGTGCEAALADIARCQCLQALQLSEGDLAEQLPMMADAGISMPQVRCLRLRIASRHDPTYLFDIRMWRALPRVFPGLEGLELDAGGCFLSGAFREPLARLPELRTLSIINVPALTQAVAARIVAGVPRLERFEVAFSWQSRRFASRETYAVDADSLVTEDSLGELARSLRPRLARCVLLPRGSRWEEW